MRFTLPKKNKKFSKLWITLLALCFILYAFWFMEQHLKPAFMAMAEARATQIATQSIHDIIYDKMKGDMDPESLILLKTDQQGRVVFIQPNTVEMNKLSSDITLRAQVVLKNLSEEKIEIPLGQVFGHPLFAALGPRLSVTIIPSGTIQVKFLDQFEQAGINQTRHMIYLSASTRIKIAIPFVSQDIQVDTQVPITEYVVVGDVPSTYLQIPIPPEERSSQK